jgi:uncharacterized membrane protein
MNDVTFAAVTGAFTSFVTAYPAIIIVLLAGTVVGIVVALVKRLAKGR